MKKINKTGRTNLLFENYNKKNNEILIAESTAKMLLEAMDNKELESAAKTLKKLNTLKDIASSDKNLKELYYSVSTAAAEITEFTGGGLGALMKRGLSSLAQKFGAKAGGNPILKALTFMSALESGFESLYHLTDINLTIKWNDETILQQIEKDPSIKDKNRIKKALTTALLKAFRPVGAWAKISSLFGSNGGVPFIENAEGLAKGLLDSPAKIISKLISISTTGISTTDITPPTEDAPKDPPKDINNTKDLAKALAAKSRGGQPKTSYSKFINVVATESELPVDVIEKVVSVLLANKKIVTEGKDNFGVVHFRTLTREDVADAQMALLKCEGSVLNWVLLMTEGALSGLAKQIRKSAGGDVFKGIKDKQIEKALDHIDDYLKSRSMKLSG